MEGRGGPTGGRVECLLGFRFTLFTYADLHSAGVGCLSVLVGYDAACSVQLA